ncbi:MAG: DNA-binding protein [Marinospirillum sp.]|uniref:hypothetical protein n=1 Tax=Marinospirillum sp. TaxID=2183934 RepID=UPI001A0D5987|nr:hypothetical protein [Marinospirillum sp.]MBE0507892.1 DNA-binding protein [Marinospirillum sp.]
MSNATSDRVLWLIEKHGARGLERKTGIKEDRWNNIKRGKARCSLDELDALGRVFPELRWWLMTGETMPEQGQISPEVEGIRETLKKTGTDTE